MSDLKKEIVAIFDALSSKENDDKAELLGLISDSETVKLAIKMLQDDNIQMFDYVCRQITSPIDAIISDANAKHQDYYGFAVKNYRMIERNFCSIFKNIEGLACSADKSRAVMRALVRFLRTGEEIKFNYYGKHTFHLPKKVFKTHAQIYDFFVALMRLEMGYPVEFIKIYGAIIGGAYE